MPTLSLSWDLCIVIFFAVVMSVGFLLGKHRTVRMIVGCYIAIIAVQGVRTIAGRIVGDVSVTLGTVGIPVDTSLLALAKVFLFSIALILFQMKSGIDVTLDRQEGRIVSIVSTALLGFAAAGLIGSTILTYIAGSSVLIDASGLPITAIAPSIFRSTLLELLVRNQDIWFALPALFIVLGSLTDEG